MFIYRRYGTKCSGCGQGIAPSDLVRKPRDKVFHLNCFTCCICRKQLSTGEQLYVLDDNKFICKDDFILGKSPGQHAPSLTGKSIFKLLTFLSKTQSFIMPLKYTLHLYVVYIYISN